MALKDLRGAYNPIRIEVFVVLLWPFAGNDSVSAHFDLRARYLNR
jgi:hypothetical protein